MDLFREPPHGADTPITPELAVGGVRSRCVLSGTGVSVLEAGTSQNCPAARFSISSRAGPRPLGFFHAFFTVQRAMQSQCMPKGR